MVTIPDYNTYKDGYSDGYNKAKQLYEPKLFKIDKVITELSKLIINSEELKDKMPHQEFQELPINNIDAKKLIKYLKQILDELDWRDNEYRNKI